MDISQLILDMAQNINIPLVINIPRVKDHQNIIPIIILFISLVEEEVATVNTDILVVMEEIMIAIINMIPTIEMTEEIITIMI